MKKVIFVISLLFLLVESNAQNWQLMQRIDTLNFNASNIHSVAVDSVITVGQDTIYYFNQTLNDSLLRNYYPTTNLTKPNLLGKSVIHRRDSFILKNHNDCTLVLKPKLPVGSTWVMMQSMNQRFFEGKVDDMIWGYTPFGWDNLKQITIKYKDSLGRKVNHYINNDTILVSENYGLIKTVNFYNFPDQDPAASLKYSRVDADLSIIRREMFNYSVGDSFQLRHEHYDVRLSPKFQPHDYSNHVILTKTFSNQLDTVSYTEEVKRRSINAKWDYVLDSMIYDTTFTVDTINHLFTNLDKSAIRSLGNAPIYENDSLVSINRLSVSDYNGRIHQKIDQNLFYWDTLYNPFPTNYTHAWQVGSYHINRFKNEIEGITLFSEHREHFIFNANYKFSYLTYYKKGLEIWGNKKNLIVGLEEEGIELKAEGIKLKVYPNPTKERLYIQFQDENELKEVQLFDLVGREQKVDVMKESVVQYSINVANLHKGIFLLTIKSEEGKVFSKKIIVQ